MSSPDYPNASPANAERAAAAIESGSTPPRESLRDTAANQQGLRDLEVLANDPNLTPAERAQARQELADRLRSQPEPTGDLHRDVTETRAQVEAASPTQSDTPRAAGDAQREGATPDVTQDPNVAADRSTQPTGERVEATDVPQPTGEAPRQHASDLDQLYRDAAVAQQELSGMTRAIAGDLGGRPLIPDNLKGRPRAQEKIDADYGGDPSRITDLARSSIEFDNPNQIRQAMEMLRGQAEIVRVKDRFANPVDGYRDVMLNLRMANGHIVEMQLHLRAILDVKNGAGHPLYEQVRSIDARAATENRPLTAQETTDRAALVSEMTQLYDDAYAGTLTAPEAPDAATAATPGVAARPAPSQGPEPDAAPATEPDAPAAAPATSSPAVDPDDGRAPDGEGRGTGQGEGGAVAAPAAPTPGAPAGPAAPGAETEPAAATPATLTSETAYTASEAANDRTTVGVGELVYFTASAEEGVWSASTGTITETGDWTAPSTADSSTITFTPTGGEAVTMAMTILAPSAVVLAKTSEVSFPSGTMGAGFLASVTFHPLTVSFAATDWKEQGGEAPEGATGYFEDKTLPTHEASGWRSIGDGNTGPGDRASFSGFPAPWTQAGSFQWNIIQKYRVQADGGDGHVIETLPQVCNMAGTPHPGRTTVTKGGQSSAARSP